MNLKPETTEMAKPGRPDAGRPAAPVNPGVEDAYWRQNYKTRSYFKSGRPYADFQPAFRYGWESAIRHAGKRFEDVEYLLEHDWNQVAGRLTWSESREATRDAWSRVRGH